MDDRTGIIETVDRYATALDARDWALLDDVFVEDAVGDFGQGEILGRERLRRMIRSMLGGCGPTQHLLGNYVVEIDDGGATARCTCQVRAFHASASPGDDRVYELFGAYRDRLVRTPEGWRIARRQLVIRHELGSRAVLGVGP